MEAFSVYEDERKRQNRWFDSLGQQINEVRRNVISPLIPSLAGHLDQGQVEGVDLFKEFKARLFHALEVLGSTAELIHPTPEILAASRASVLIEDPTDNLILASILDHSKNHTSETKIFLSENRRDFDINPGANVALRDAGVRFFADAVDVPRMAREPAGLVKWSRDEDRDDPGGVEGRPCRTAARPISTRWNSG